MFSPLSYLNSFCVPGHPPVDHPDPPGLDPEEDLEVHPDEDTEGDGDCCQEGVE